MPISRNETILPLLIYPNATSNKVLGYSSGTLRVKVSAPPTKGRANKELIAFLSRLLGVSKSSIDILKGHTSRSKLITINGLSWEEIKNQLSI